MDYNKITEYLGDRPLGNMSNKVETLFPILGLRCKKKKNL